MVLAHRAPQLHRSERIARALISIKDAVALLEVHPRRIAAAVAQTPASRLGGEPMLDMWTATDVLAHLRSCADTFDDVVPRILAEDHPKLQVLGPRDPARATNYRDITFAVSFQAFVRQRARLLVMLRRLTPAAGARAAVIVDRGRRRERSVHEYIDWLARHEARHVDEYERFGRKTARSARLSSMTVRSPASSRAGAASATSARAARSTKRR